MSYIDLVNQNEVQLFFVCFLVIGVKCKVHPKCPHRRWWGSSRCRSLPLNLSHVHPLWLFYRASPRAPPQRRRALASSGPASFLAVRSIRLWVPFGSERDREQRQPLFSRCGVIDPARFHVFPKTRASVLFTQSPDCWHASPPLH